MPVVQKHKAVSTLPPDRLAQLHQMIRRGEGYKTIAVTIQDKWLLLLDYNFDALAKAVQRYIGDFQKKEVVERMVAVGALDNVVGYTQRVNVMAELERSLAIEDARIAKLSEVEDKMTSALLNQLSDALARRAWILKELGKLQLETGVLPRAKKTIDVVPGQNGQPGQFVITEARRDLRAALIEDARKLIEARKAIDGVYDVAAAE